MFPLYLLSSWGRGCPVTWTAVWVNIVLREYFKNKIPPDLIRLPNSIHVSFRYFKRNIVINYSIDKTKGSCSRIYLTVQQSYLVAIALHGICKAFGLLVKARQTTRSTPWLAISWNCSRVGWPALAKRSLYWRKLIISANSGAGSSTAKDTDEKIDKDIIPNASFFIVTPYYAKS